MWSVRKKNPNEEALKETIANQAFNKLLKRNVDYTVAAESKGAILVKRVVKWAYLDVNGKDIEAIFTITTDKGEFAFQVSNDKIHRIPTDIAKSLYKFE